MSNLEHLDAETRALFKQVERINKALKRYQAGNSEIKASQRTQIDFYLRELRSLLEQDQAHYTQLFKRVSEAVANNQPPSSLSDVPEALQHEANILKAVGLKLPKPKKVQRLYSQHLNEGFDPELALSMLTTPEAYLQGVQTYVDRRLQLIDETVNLPRKAKKAKRSIHNSPAVYLVSGMVIMTANVFTPTAPLLEVSVALGAIFVQKGIG